MAAAALRWCRWGLLAWLLLAWADAGQHPTAAVNTEYREGPGSAVSNSTSGAAQQRGPQPSRLSLAVAEAQAAAAATQQDYPPTQQLQRRLISSGSSGPPSSGAVVYVGGGKGGSSGLYTGSAAPPPVQQEQSLRQALANDSVGVIVVVGAVDISSAWVDTQDEILINRNLTITGVDPAAPSPMLLPATLDDTPLLNWGYQQGGLVLCGTCTLTIAHLATEGGRRGAGPLLDTVRAAPGGRVVMHDTLRLRAACTPSQRSLNYTLTTPRPPEYPGAQQAALVDVNYRGQAFPDSLLSADVVQYANPVEQEGSPTRYGYTLVVENATRLCGSYVSPSCLAQGQPDLCVNRAIDALLAGQGGSSGQLSSGAAGGLAVGVVLGVLLLGGLSAVFVLHRRARKRSAWGLLPATQAGGGPWNPEGRHQGSPSNSVALLEAGERLMMDARLWQLAGTSTASNALMSGGHTTLPGGLGSTSMLRSGSSSSPGEDDNAIMLGVLLGAGAYGRVYRGRWRGMAVAVKVIDHDVNTAMAVMNEVKLVTSFNHPNVVRAYYSATWVSRPPPSTTTAREEGSPAAGRRPTSLPTSTSGSAAGMVSLVRAASGAAGLSLLPPQPLSPSSHSDTSAAGASYRPNPPSPGAAPNLPAVAEEGQAGGSQESASSPAHQPAPPPPPPTGGTPHTPPGDAAQLDTSIPPGQPPAPSPEGSQPSSSVTTGQVLQSVYALMTLPPDADMPEDLQDLAPAGDPGDHEGGQQQQAAGADSCTGLSFWVNRQPTLSTAAALPSGPYQIVSSTAPPKLQPSGAAAAAVVLLGSSGSSPGAGSGVGTASLSEPSSMGAGAGKPPASGSNRGSPERPAAPPITIPAVQAGAATAPEPGTGGTALAGKRRGSRGGGTTGEGRAQTWLVLELCSGGTLQDVLDSGGSNTADVLWLLRDAAAGVAYLHARNVVHGDLNARNVLVAHSQESPCGFTAKVGDFGLARRLTGTRSHRTTSTAGTINHTAPEVLRLGKLSPAADVYAFGIMMWEAFTGDTAFSTLHYGQIFEVVVLGGARPRIPDTIPPGAASLMSACWSATPCERPTMVAVVGVLQRLLESWAGTPQEAWSQQPGGAQQHQQQQQQQSELVSRNWEWAQDAAAAQQAAAAAGGQWVVEVVAANTQQGQRLLGSCAAAAAAAAVAVQPHVARKNSGSNEPQPVGLAASHHIQDL